MAEDRSIFEGIFIFMGIFKGELLLSMTPVTGKTSILTTQNYKFDEPDSHHDNVFHGKMFDCSTEKAFTSVSCMLFSRCAEAFEMKKHLETLDEAAGIVGGVIKTYGVVHVPKSASLSSGSKAKVSSVSVSGSKPEVAPVIMTGPALKLTPPMQFGRWAPNTPPMQFGSYLNAPETSSPPKDVIVLVTGRISMTTFDDWLKSRTSHDDALILFRDLFYIVKKICIVEMCAMGYVSLETSRCWYIPLDLELIDYKISVIELDEGIWSDLRELHKMVSDSMPLTTAEWILFNDLCEEYAPKKVDCVSKLTYKGPKLREGSFLTLSSSIIWNSAERYDVVRKLGEYRSLNIASYETLVSDSKKFGHAIPNINWYARLKNAAPNSDEDRLHAVYTDNCAKGNNAFSSSESIRYFHRCAYEHFKRTNKDYTEVSDILYKVFPEAPSKLYRMMVDILYRQTRLKNPMPSVIDFFWKEPHRFK